MRAWPGDESVAHLIFLDHRQVPTPGELGAAIDHARRKGARAVRTSAMFPDTSAVVAAEGFVPIDRLALLQTDLAGHDPALRQPTHAAISPMRPWHLTPCSRIDRAAFGLMWGNTAASLRDIRSATPWHHARVARSGKHLAGFAISGSAGDIGYLQRLAVDPDHRRRGHATALVMDALDWMSGRGVRRALVNTGVDNTGALDLYGGIGFSRLTDELVIAELGLS
jgi:ribosomal protein S18 acetylase RimI-like enzyme